MAKLDLKQADLHGKKQFRIIPSVFPPINFFEELVDPGEMEALWEIENLTNDRIQQETGHINLVPSEDRISGPGASVIMAAFTHIHYPSRFTDGSFGIYYAGLSLETALKETVFHRERFLWATHEDPCEITMRLYEGHIKKPLDDIRSSYYSKLHHPDDYTHSQEFGRKTKESKSWGLVYNSVRNPGEHCIAILRPPAISLPKQTKHFRYVWNGEKITDILLTTLV